jgi:predicted nucleic acid-binding protein
VQVLVDTSVWMDYFEGRATAQTEWLDLALGREWLVTADLIVGEVLSGIVRDRQWKEARGALRRFRVYTLGGLELTLRCAEHQRRLRSAGAPVPGLVDCLIATLCIEAGIPLLHSDPAFQPFERYLALRSPDRRDPGEGRARKRQSSKIGS